MVAPHRPLSAALPGTWELVSRIDDTDAGEPRVDPSLGAEPAAILFHDRSGHFAAQFMKRDRSAGVVPDTAVTGVNNSRARDGYDAYFGTYVVDDSAGTVTQHLRHARAEDA
jgi:lipocalin-like protein